jgi:AcrR family transcriptional regulator
MAPKIVDREERRRELIEVAAKLFAEKGFRNSRIADIAAAAGVAKGLVYDYFRSKEELFFAVFTWYNDKISLWIGERMGTADSARERLTLFANLFVQAGLDHIQLYGLTLEFWAAAGLGTYRGRFLKSFQDAYEEMRTMVSETIREGQAAGEFKGAVDPRAMAVMLVGALDAVILQYWLDSSLDPVAKVNHFLETLMNGMARPPMPDNRRQP